jgi:predicted negative regulator of RcsB-dependent stress response
MDNLKAWANQYFWLIVVIFLAVVGTFSYLIYGSYQESSFQQSIQTNQTEAQTAVNTATNANTNAANFSLERRTEDAVRDQTIAPRLETARRNSQTSKTELERAERKLKVNEKKIRDINASWADNCLRLKRLFPDERFEYCDDRPAAGGSSVTGTDQR